MTVRKPDVEAYVLMQDMQAIASVLSPALGPVQLTHEPEMHAHVWRSDHTSVIVRESTDRFFSVFVIGDFPWRSDIELARLLASQLQCITRCDPEAEHPHTAPSTFLEISPTSHSASRQMTEKLMDWVDEADQ